MIKWFEFFQPFIEDVNKLDGHIVDIGCHCGEGTIQMLNELRHPLIAFDWFRGLSRDHYEEGDGEDIMKVKMASSPELFWENVSPHKPTLVEGDVYETLSKNLPEKIAVASIDLDLYKPTKFALETVWDRIVPNGLILCRNYNFNITTGVKKAADEFLVDKKFDVLASETRVTIFRKH